MTPAIATSAAARTRRIARDALPALVLAGGLVATGAAGRAHADDHGATTLRVASYNVQFVTPDLPLVRHVLREWPGHKPNVTDARRGDRRRAWRASTSSPCRRPSTTRGGGRCLERLESAGRSLRQALAPAVRRHVRVRRRPGRGERVRWLPLVGNELALASRLPVVAVDSHVYRHAAEEDRLAAKGVLHARLARAADDLIDVFVTHLQAGQEHGAVRRRQIEELTSFIRRKVNGAAHPVLVLGDFNVRGSLVDRPRRPVPTIAFWCRR